MQRTSRWSKKTGIFGLTLLGVLLTASLLYAAMKGGEVHHEVHALVTRDMLWNFLWRTLNFAALMVILVKFGAKPLANVLGSRREAIRDQMQDLEAHRTEAEQLYKEHEGKLASLDQEVQQILAAARAQGEIEKERIVSEANRAAEDLQRHAEMAVQHEFGEAKRKLREEIAEQAAAMAEEIIRKSFQGADQAKLIEDYLSKVEG